MFAGLEEFVAIHRMDFLEVFFDLHSEKLDHLGKWDERLVLESFRRDFFGRRGVRRA